MGIAPLWDNTTPRPKITFNDMHYHTEYSLKDGMVRITDLDDPKHNKGQAILNAERRGTGFITATDHGNMYGQALLASEAKKYGLKHAPGCEFYVAPHSRTDKMAIQGKPTYYHMCAWARNKEGYSNLCMLQKLSYVEGFYMRPRIDQELIDKYGDGIMWSDACIAGPMSYMILNDDLEGAMQYAEWMLNRFGEDFYIEFQNHHIDAEDRVNEIKVEWANQHGVPIIATTDAHFYAKEDKDAHRALLCIQWGRWFDDPTFQGFAGDGYWLMSEDELLERYPVEYLNNTQLLADKVEPDIITFGNITPPKFQVPVDFMKLIGGESDVAVG